MSEQPASFGQWCIVDLMGHLRLAGYVTEEEHFGAKMGRVEVPMNDGTTSTQWFGGSSVYMVTATTEDIAREIAKRNQPEPISPWQLAQLKAPATTPEDLEGERVPRYEFDDDEEATL